MAVEVKAQPRRSKPTFGSLNEHLICTLCSGYLVDATTIIECLHSFCRSCVVQYLQSSSVCPTCKVQLDKGCPLRSLKPDKTLQDIVYKLVPNLFSTEMQRRKVYYDNHPQYVDQTTPEQRGDSIERFYSPDDSISLSLEYHGRRRLSLDSDDSGVNFNNNDEKTVPPKRYLKCPAMFTIGLLKKFIRLKFDLPNDFVIDIFQRESYPDEYTLLDIAYIYPWKRSEPMRFFYHVRDPRVPERGEDVEREMPALSAVIGTRAGRASRRASVAAQSAPSTVSTRKPRTHPNAKAEQVAVDSSSSNGPNTSRQANIKGSAAHPGLIPLKVSRASPPLKISKPVNNVPTRSCASSSMAELPIRIRSPKPSTADFANGSLCGKATSECQAGQQSSSSASTVENKIVDDSSVKKRQIATTTSERSGGYNASTNSCTVRSPLNSVAQKNEEKQCPKSVPNIVQNNQSPKPSGSSLSNATASVSSSTNDPTLGRRGSQPCSTEVRIAPQPPIANAVPTRPPREHLTGKSGMLPAMSSLNAPASNKAALLPNLPSAKVPVRGSFPAAKSSFTATVTTRTLNGGFVTVKNPVARMSNGVTPKATSTQKLPLLLPKIEASPIMLMPTVSPNSNFVNSRTNQKHRRVKQGPLTNKTEICKPQPGTLGKTVSVSKELSVSDTASSNAISSTVDSQKCVAKPTAGITTNLTLNKSNTCSNASTPVKSICADSTTALTSKLQNASQKEKNSDEEKKVETAKAILQLSMGFKRCHTPTDPALQNRIDKIVKDLQQEDVNCAGVIKTEPLSPAPSPNLSPRASPAPAAHVSSIVAGRNEESSSQSTNQDLNILPKVDGLTITPIDPAKRKSTNSPVLDEKRMRLSGSSPASTLAGQKRSSEIRPQSPMPPKVAKVDNIVDNIKQKQDMSPQQHREQKINTTARTVPSVQQKKPTLTEQKKSLLQGNLQPQIVLEKCSPEVRQLMDPLQQKQQLSQQEKGAPSFQAQSQQKLPSKPSQQKTPIPVQMTQRNVSPKPSQNKTTGQQEVNKKIAQPDSPVKNKKPIPDLQRLQKPPGSLANTTVNGSLSLAEVKEQLAKNGQYSPPGQQRTPPKLMEISQQNKSAPPAPPSSLHRDGYGALDLSSASPRAEHGGSWTPPPSIAQTLAKRQQQLAPASHKPSPSSLSSSSSPSPPADSPGASVSPELYIDQSVIAQQQALLQHLRLQSLFQAQAVGLKKAIKDWATVDRLGVKTSPSPNRK